MEVLIQPRPRDLGGFSVLRVLPSGQRRMVGPFIFVDHIGPADFVPGEGVDVRPHPHIGLATVTYLFEGGLTHRDSLGFVQDIAPGDVNWMTAGRGIAHSERTPAELRARGHRLHGMQTWVALPLAHEEAAPAFHHHAASSLPERNKDGVQLRVVAGEAFGMRSPVQTFTPTLYVAATMEAGASLSLPDQHAERGVYVVEGEVEIGGARVPERSLAVLAGGGAAHFETRGGCRLMLLGGEAMDGERHIWWNFVSSSTERIEQARRDWADGRFDPVPGETEFIPLPER
ncbi:MAG TPA: pirin family protein [Xanthomonadaceae bacterium]|nr:pirin family protein [Xanthomonadaceae bacterium]